MKNALRLALALWLAVSFAALAAMFHLWWERERVLYVGKSIEEQREIVFQRAGLPAELVRQSSDLAQHWPPDLRYRARGDANALSYVTYLLIPRIPERRAEPVLQVQGRNLLVQGKPISAPSEHLHVTEAASPKGLIFSFAVLLGWAALLRKIWRGYITWPEALALACLFFTLLTLASRFFFFSVQPAFGGAIVLALVGWAMLLAHSLLHLLEKKDRPARTVWNRREQVFAAVLGFILFASLLWSFLMAVVVVPDDWDAWAIWGSKAKVLALGHGPLDDLSRFGHADYPLLWPVIWAFSGWFAGGWEECWSKGWGTLFLLLCVWEMILAVNEEHKQSLAGLLAAALFVSVPNVPLIASWAYAEAPLWLMFTCGLTCLLRWRRQGRRVDAVLAGLFAAAAAHTKNEGLLFAGLLALLLVLFSRGQGKAILFYLLAFLLCWLPWFWWTRLYLDLGSAVIPQQWDLARLYWAAERLLPALKAVASMWLDPRQWNLVGLGIALALISTLFSRRSALLLLPLGLLTGSFVIILFNDHEIYWQIGTAWNRLSVQALPLFLLILCSKNKTSAIQ